MVSCCIHYLVNAGEGKSILRASIIEVRIIDAHVPLVEFLGTTMTLDNHLGY